MKTPKREQIRALTQGAMVCALTVVLSEIRLYRMPLGGSITGDMIPVIVYALLWGSKRGFFTGVAAGTLQFLVKAEVYHPVQVIMDYPLAYGVLGFAGLLREKPYAAVAFASILRLIIHTISGIVFFSSFTPEGWQVWKYSLAYNASFLIPSAILATAAVKLTLLIKKRLKVIG